MATWQDVNRFVDSVGGSRLSETMDRVLLPGCEPGRKQAVYIAYEVMKPDLEFIKIGSAFAMIDLVEVGSVIRKVGPLQIGCLSYQHVYEDGKEVDGFVTLASSTPLGSLDLAEGAPHFGIYLHIFGRAADALELEFAEPGRPDFF